MHKITTNDEALAIEQLQAIAAELNHDPEAAHGAADQVLLNLLLPQVRVAYRQVEHACPWWVTS